MTATSTMAKERARRFFLGAMAIFIGLFIAYFLLGILAPESVFLTLGWEDQPLEYMGAAFWLAASAICAYRLIRGQEPRFLLAMWMVLAFLFLGEEISWFQRIFGFGTPEAFADLNEQNELNLHNLEALQGTQNLFRLGFTVYFLVFPLLSLARRMRTWARKVGYVAPSGLFLIMVWGVIGASAILQAIGPEEARRATVETRESFYAFAVLVYVYVYLRTDALSFVRSSEVAADA